MNETARDTTRARILKQLEQENAALRQDCENLERLVVESNELLHLTRFALNQVREATYLLDNTGYLVYVNDEVCRTLGYTDAELLQMRVTDIDPNWTSARWNTAWSELRSPGSRVIETTHRCKDGALFPVQVNVSYFEYRGKEYSLALARNLNGRERPTLAQWESEQRCWRAIGNVSYALYLLQVTPEGHLCTLEINPAGDQSFGIQRGEFIGRSFDKTLPNEVADVVVDKVRLLVQSGLTCDDNQTLELPSGCNYYRTTLIPMLDEAGRIHRVVCIARDMTAKGRTESLSTTQLALKAQFRKPAKNSLGVICRNDCQCRVAYANSGFAATLRNPLQDLRGKPPTEDEPDDRYPQYQALFASAIEIGTKRQIEVTMPDAGSDVRHFHIRMPPEHDLKSDIVGALDITERKEAEQHLRESYELLRELTSRRETARDEERKRIARELHDELGQDLTALRMGASTLRLRFGHDNPDLAEHAQKMVLLSDRTMQVLRDVVTSLRPAVLDAGIVAALEWLAARFSQNGRTSCHLNVPEEDAELSEEQAIVMFRIAQEALTNVTRHADAQQVFITLGRSGEHCLLEVRDDGRGFDPMAITRKSFGLAGMKERALMLGGTVEVASSQGHGTSIKVRVQSSQRR